MTKFKDFGSSFVSDDAEPISFKLYGEDFFCVKAVQGKVLLDLVADSDSEDPSKAALIIDKFFSFVLQDESAERFNSLIRDKNKIVPVETLSEITGWLVEQYTNRPEEQPEA